MLVTMRGELPDELPEHFHGILPAQVQKQKGRPSNQFLRTKAPIARPLTPDAVREGGRVAAGLSSNSAKSGGLMISPDVHVWESIHVERKQQSRRR
jgi:hypothetical protein